MMPIEISEFEGTAEFAARLDAADPLRSFRERFHMPRDAAGRPIVYFTGNSLGLQPTTARAYVDQELEDWARLGVEGHLHARNPWLPYHEFVTEPMARVVGAQPIETVDIAPTLAPLMGVPTPEVDGRCVDIGQGCGSEPKL